MTVTAIVPAAGSGERMGATDRKPYLTLLGRPILAHTLAVLDSVAAITEMIIPVFPGEEDRCCGEILDPWPLRTPTTVIAGGATRQESVRNALARLCPECRFVLIHDGARPLITAALVEQALVAVQTRAAVTLAVPVTDTIVQAGDDDRIECTLPRHTLFSIQTPQVFEVDTIRAAHQLAERDGFAGTDDASLVMHLGRAVHIVAGDYRNLKITTAADLPRAALLMHGRCAS